MRAINRLSQSPEAVLQVMIRPRFSTAELELHPLRILNPGPHGGQSAFLFRGEWSVAVRGPRGATHASAPLLPGEVVRLVSLGRRIRLEPDALRLSGGRIGVHHLLDAPWLLDVEWLVDETVIARPHRSGFLQSVGG